MLLASVAEDSETYETTRRSISSRSRNAATPLPASASCRQSRGSVAINAGFYNRKKKQPEGPAFGLPGVGLLDGTEAANRWFLQRVDHDALDWSVRAKLLDVRLRLGQLTSITAAHPDFTQEVLVADFQEHGLHVLGGP